MRSGQYRFAAGIISFFIILAAVGYWSRPPVTLAQTGAITGNWAVKSPRADGTLSKAYFNLRQDGDKINGTIRSTQFFYTISESTGGPEAFTLTAKMKDGHSH